METKTLRRNFFQRLFGVSATKTPADEGCWEYSNGKLVVDLSRATDLSSPGTGICLEKKGLPERVLVVHGDDGRYYAFQNRCRHMGRRVDPVPESGTVQCCSVSKSTYSYKGETIGGPAKSPLKRYPLVVEEGKLTITMDS